MEGLQPLARLPQARGATLAASARAWIGERLTTTPGRLVLVSALLVAGLCASG
jgi:hypothetical protein